MRDRHEVFSSRSWYKDLPGYPRKLARSLFFLLSWAIRRPSRKGVELGRADADGVAEHLAGAQSARLFDVLASDFAAAHYYEDLVLGLRIYEGFWHRDLPRPAWNRPTNGRISWEKATSEEQKDF